MRHQLIDKQTGEIIDIAQFRREQARLSARHQQLRAYKSRIYRHVRAPEPQTLRRFIATVPRLLRDKHYGEIMGALWLLLGVVWWMWHVGK